MTSPRPPPPSRLPEVNTNFFETYICRDINASICLSKFPNELKQIGIVTANKVELKLFNEDYTGISIHKTELANCGSSDPPANLQGLDFGTRFHFNNLVARNISITTENVVNMGQYYSLWYALHEIKELINKKENKLLRVIGIFFVIFIVFQFNRP